MNDSLGHQVGDQLLRAVGERFGTLVRKGTVCRLGGDEFTVILENIRASATPSKSWATDRQALPTLCRRGAQPHIGVSAGISSFPSKRPISPTRCASPTSPCTRPRPRARNDYCIYTSDRCSSQSPPGSGRRLAPWHRAGRILPHVPNPRWKSSPVVLSIEALCAGGTRIAGSSPGTLHRRSRANRADRPPGTRIISLACQDWAAWRDAGVTSALGRQRLRPPTGRTGLQDDLVVALAAAGRPRPKLEVGNHRESDSQRKAHFKVHASPARRRRHRMVLDDFGTGYSSLTYLTKFPIANPSRSIAVSSSVFPATQFLKPSSVPCSEWRVVWEWKSWSKG